MEKFFAQTSTRIDDETLDQLTTYSWPGNIRELANVVEREHIRLVCERCGWRIRGDGGAAQILV